MRKHTIELTERELRCVLSAFNIVQEDRNIEPYWWRAINAPSEAYAQRLYERLKTHGT